MNHQYIQLGGESAQGQTSQRANQPGTGGEQARGWTSKEAKKPQFSMTIVWPLY